MSACTRWIPASLLALVLSPGGLLAAPIDFSASLGPLPVGVTTTVLVDHSRTDALTHDARTLVTEVWYPAADAAREAPRNKYSDFFPAKVTPELEAFVQKHFRISLAQVDKLFWNHAVRNAPVREGKFPLIVFSHGNGGSRHQNTFWCDFVASHGYVVVSADHTGNASMTLINGRMIPYERKERLNSAADRPKDMSFLLDQMTHWHQGGDSRFAGKLDLGAVCACGMSFGSMTAVRCGDADPRFKSVIAMSGAPVAHTNLTIPILWMLGTEDTTIGTQGNTLIRTYHDRQTGPSFLLEMKNGGHYSFTDMFKLNKDHGDGVGSGKRRATGEPFDFTPMETTYTLVNAYSLAFVELYSRGNREALRFLQTNHWPDDLVWQASGVEPSEQPKP
jgi:dienelactone hydrolase